MVGEKGCVEEALVMRDFYVQLLSSASTNEFPNNRANSFKNRLPQPLVLDDGDWKVGVANVTYPIPHILPGQPLPQHPLPNFKKNDVLCRIEWSMKSRDVRGNMNFTRWSFKVSGADLIRDRMLITGGKALMRYIVNRYKVMLREEITNKEDNLLTTNGSGKKFYPEFRWEGDDLILDNSEVYLDVENASRPNRERPKVIFGKKLVEAMKWLTREDPVSYWMMKGNLMTEADALSKDIKKDWTIPSVPVGERFGSWTDIWKYSDDGLQLSSYCNWRFINLDESYREAFGGVSETVLASAPPRGPMYLYSNVGRSTIMGNRVTDLLREIPHDVTKMSYEPLHIHYKPVRSQLVDIVETQLAENDGKLVDFASGVTSVTLHFKDE